MTIAEAPGAVAAICHAECGTYSEQEAERSANEVTEDWRRKEERAEEENAKPLRKHSAAQGSQHCVPPISRSFPFLVSDGAAVERTDPEGASCFCLVSVFPVPSIP